MRVVDADVLAREVVEPGTPAHAQIVVDFGKVVLQPDGRLDRAKLGDLIFPDPVERSRSTRSSIPQVRFEKIVALERQGITASPSTTCRSSSSRVATPRWRAWSSSGPATQIRRLMARDGATEEAAHARTASQMPLAVKARAGDYVIDNSGSPEATAARVREVYRALLEDLRQLQARR